MNVIVKLLRFRYRYTFISVQSETFGPLRTCADAVGGAVRSQIPHSHSVLHVIYNDQVWKFRQLILLCSLVFVSYV